MNLSTKNVKGLSLEASLPKEDFSLRGGKTFTRQIPPQQEPKRLENDTGDSESSSAPTTLGSPGSENIHFVQKSGFNPIL
ncbi:hypothetical protein PCANC_18475 [Puccinia coronata f. sp. avenae]|uniref:Uncharacterized protein n=1 Tax=Puccinia coronata f. sp. avenae TaxID=200324 RepID=A0A2N5SEJ8_9BASI|nr:hypothetical protein PCANC_18475 [Puccinia coronata f. sp. avenae]